MTNREYEERVLKFDERNEWQKQEVTKEKKGGD
jgi:hypothetical protein